MKRCWASYNDDGLKIRAVRRVVMVGNLEF